MIAPNRLIPLHANPKRASTRVMNRLPIMLLCLFAAACGNKDRDEGSIKIALPEAGPSGQHALADSPLAQAPTTPAVWTHAPSAHAAWYGPPGTTALLAISCEGSETRAARLVIVRFAPADKGAQALFAIQGSKGILRLPVSAVRVGKRGSVWRGILDAADPRAEVLLGSGLKATVPGGGQLDLLPMGAAGAVVSECVVRQAQDDPSTSLGMSGALADHTLPNLSSKPETSPADK